jgi:hypothetical protein
MSGGSKRRAPLVRYTTREMGRILLDRNNNIDMVVERAKEKSQEQDGRSVRGTLGGWREV